MAEALTRKEIIQAIWNKVMGKIGHANISGIGDGTVSGAIASLNSKISYDFTNAKYLMGTANAVRRGNVVTITYTGDWKEGTPANNIGTIATLPENFIPAVRCQTVCIPFNNIQIIIDTSGNILAHNYGSAIAAQSAGRFLLTYVAKD